MHKDDITTTSLWYSLLIVSGIEFDRFIYLRNGVVECHCFILVVGFNVAGISDSVRDLGHTEGNIIRETRTLCATG